LRNFFQEFTNKNYDKIVREGNVSREELKEALNVIVHLNPKPAPSGGRDEELINTIIPEFQVTENNGKFDISLTNQRLPELKLNRKFMDMISQLKESTNAVNKKDQKGAIQFVRQKIHSARWFIDAIQQRQATMLKTMEAIVIFQNEFFITGDFKKIKPMILKDIAERVGMDISTISRVTSTKYVQTSFGVFRIKDFFTSVLLKEDGAEVSNKVIQEFIIDMVEKENKSNPMSDLEISNKLKQKGFTTARRTVAKYREHIGIPIARMRKQLF
jgi:RNA polymerase sigma-54 factor